MTPDVEAHFQSADEFLRESEHLIAGGFYRGAVGRAYYAMFHAATAALLNASVERRSHHGIISAFAEVFIKTGMLDKKYHQYLREAFEARSECDYLSFVSAGRRQAEVTAGRAKEFIIACKDLCR